MSAKKDKKKPVWLRDEIWDDTPDIERAKELKKTENYKKIKPFLDELHKKNREKHEKLNKMILSQKNRKEINRYFNDFIVKNGFNREISDIKEKAEKEILEYDKDWNALMAIVCIIENKFKIDEIITKHNFVSFTFENFYNIQDKAKDKKEAFYLVCFKTLKVFWKEGKINLEYRNDEPFDYDDLK